MIEALLMLLSCQLAGELLVRLIGLPVPGPVLGLVLLLGALMVRQSVPDGLRTVSRGLLQNLSLLLLPAGTGVLVHLHRIADSWQVLAAAAVVSTAVTIAVTALVFRLMQRLTAAGDRRKGD